MVEGGGRRPLETKLSRESGHAKPGVTRGRLIWPRSHLESECARTIKTKAATASRSAYFVTRSPARRLHLARRTRRVAAWNSPLRRSRHATNHHSDDGGEPYTVGQAPCLMNVIIIIAPQHHQAGRGDIIRDCKINEPNPLIVSRRHSFKHARPHFE